MWNDIPVESDIRLTEETAATFRPARPRCSTVNRPSVYPARVEVAGRPEQSDEPSASPA